MERMKWNAKCDLYSEAACVHKHGNPCCQSQWTSADGYLSPLIIYSLLLFCSQISSTPSGAVLFTLVVRQPAVPVELTVVRSRFILHFRSNCFLLTSL